MKCIVHNAMFCLIPVSCLGLGGVCKFYWIYFGECAQKLYDLVPPSPLLLRSTIKSRILHPCVIDVGTTHLLETPRFLFIIAYGKKMDMNTLHSCFPKNTLLKARTNRLFRQMRTVVIVHIVA